MGERHKAREYALHALYMYDIANTPIEDLLKLDWVDEEIEDETLHFAADIIKGTIGKIETIDALITRYCKNWSFERISSIDKAILRLSVYSLIHQKDVSPAITINEGIELGKIFGGDNSGHFINGILDAIHKQEFS